MAACCCPFRCAATARSIARSARSSNRSPAGRGRYGEAIYRLAALEAFGEGPTQVASGQFGEGKMKPFEAADIRFTTKGPVLYAMTLGRPRARVTIASLANSGSVKRVEVVGINAPLTFTQDGAGLHVSRPADRARRRFRARTDLRRSERLPKIRRGPLAPVLRSLTGASHRDNNTAAFAFQRYPLASL